MATHHSLLRQSVPDHSTLDVVKAIKSSNGAHSVAGLAKLAGVSRQQLTRRFARHVGASPKLMLRVARLQATLASLIQPSSHPISTKWAALAGHHGLFDQSHFINDFTDLVGVTPRRWLAEQAGQANCEAASPSRGYNDHSSETHTCVGSGARRTGARVLGKPSRLRSNRNGSS